MNVHILIGIQAITIIVCFIALFVMLNRSMRLQQKQTEYVIFGCTIADIGLLIETMSYGNLAVMVLGRGVQAIGVSLFMVSLIVLTGHFCRIRIPAWFSSILIIADGILVAILFNSVNRDWFYSAVGTADYKGYQYLDITYGVAGVLYGVFTIFLPSLACVGMLIYSAVKDENKKRKMESCVLAVLYSIIFIVFILHQANCLANYYDPSMVVASYVFCGMVFARWRYQGVDVITAAAQNAVDSISAGVITLNEYREIIYFNETTKQIYPEIVNFTGVSIDKINAFKLPDLSESEKAEVEFNGRRYYMSRNTIYDNQNEVCGYAIMFNDMTEMYDLMEELEQARQSADAASQVKSLFVANISHEIRTPMNAIMGLSDLIIEESRGRKVYDMAVTIKKAANSLLDLVNNILDASKIESGKMDLEEEEYNLEELVIDTMKVMEIPAAQNGLSLKCNIDRSLPSVVYGDATKIRQCLINLVNNGIKFTNEGYVRVDVSGIRREDKVTLTFMVIDTGVGIKDQDVDRLFGAFEQVDHIVNKGKEGSGLGLSITKSLVELMGGIIDVSSIYGAGTTFTIRLSQKIVDPTSIEEAEQKANMEEDERFFKSESTQVLLVDDNKVNLMVAKGFLTPYGLQIDTAASGEEAVELAQSKAYNVVFMDHMMPGMDGVEAMRLIKKNYDEMGHSVYAIALTANAFGDIQSMFLSHGFNDFLSKPIDKKKLHSILLKAIPEDKRQFVEEIIEEEVYTEDELAELFMEGVDVRTAFEQRGCTQQQYIELLELYALEGMEKLRIIREAFDNKDWKNYSIHTHGLKSASINIGAMMLSERAKEHEMASKDSDNVNLEYILSDAEGLMEQYEKIIGEANRVIEKFKKAHKEVKDVDRPPIDRDKLVEMVGKVLELSEDFKSKEAAELVDEILLHDLDEDIEKTLSDVKMKFKLYDDDGAEDLLHTLVEQLES